MPMIRRLAALALTMLAACLTVRAQPANPFLGNAKAIDEGREFFNQTCTGCHGPDGAAGEMGPALGAPARRYAQATDAQIFDAIKNGIPGTQMPPARAIPPRRGRQKRPGPVRPRGWRTGRLTVPAIAPMLRR